MASQLEQAVEFRFAVASGPAGRSNGIQIARLQRPPAHSFLQNDFSVSINQQKDVDVNYVEGVASQLSAHVVRTLVLHEIVSAVPLCVVPRHDCDSRLFVGESILQMVDFFARVAAFETS